MYHEARPSRQCGHSPATRPAAEYDGVEYAGLPVDRVVLHQMNQLPIPQYVRRACGRCLKAGSEQLRRHGVQVGKNVVPVMYSHVGCAAASASVGGAGIR